MAEKTKLKTGEIRIGHTLGDYDGAPATVADVHTESPGDRRQAADTVIIPMGGGMQLRIRVSCSAAGATVSVTCPDGRLVIRPEVADAITIRVER